MGYTHKYKGKYPMEGYVLNKEFQTGGKTLNRAFPSIFCVVVKVAELIKDLLGQIWPPPLLSCLAFLACYKIPQLGGLLLTCLYITINFATTLHCDHDKGSPLAIAIFMEQHDADCKKPGSSCHLHWYFILYELAYSHHLCIHRG